MRAKINIVVFLFALAAALVVGILIPADKESVLQENRIPAEFPELTKEAFFSGNYSRNFENYLADNVGFRSFFTAQSSAFTNIKGLDLGLGRILEASKDVGTGNTGQKKKLLVQKDRIEEVFEFDLKTADQYIEMLNYYAENLPRDISLYSMLVPTQIEFERQLYKSIADNQKEAIQYIYDNLDTRIQTVDAYSVIEAHKSEYVYFRTDHHWTQLGAFMPIMPF